MLFVAAAAVGVAAAFLRSPHVVWIAVVGLLLTVFYSGGPVTLKYRAFGEAAVFLVWGPLMFLGAYVVQRQQLSWDGTGCVGAVRHPGGARPVCQQPQGRGTGS